jgi:hypothetical protein
MLINEKRRKINGNNNNNDNNNKKKKNYIRALIIKIMIIYMGKGCF